MTERTKITLERDGDVAVIVMDGPARRNALGTKARGELREAVRAAMYDDASVRALVLTGAGGHFCAGADVSEMTRNSMLRGRFNLRESGDTALHLHNGPKPVVAAIEGTAFGMGLSLALTADEVVAASDARMCAAFMRIGLLPDTGILWTLPRRVGGTKAREMLMLATEVRADEALRIGLVNQVCEPGQARAAAVARAAERAKLPPLGVAYTRAALSYRSASLADVTHAEIDYQAVLRHTDDHQEAARAFIDKRPPVFTGS